MDNTQILKQMMDFQKTTFDNAFSAMVMMQGQAEQMANNLIDQATWLPEEGRKVVADWVAAYKKGRDEYKAYVDDSFKKVEEFFATAKTEKAAKSK
jgi:polyhydroxyalkanoate synthesis regulator phasin